MQEGLKIISNQKREELTVEKLRELILEPELKEEKAKEIIYDLDILVGIILDFQAEQKQNSINLKQAA